MKEWEPHEKGRVCSCLRDAAGVRVSGELSEYQRRVTQRSIRKARSWSEKLMEIWSERLEGQNDVVC